MGIEGFTKQFDVKSKAAPSDAVYIGTKDNVEVGQTANNEDVPAAPEGSLPLRPTNRPQRATSESTITTTGTQSKPAGGSKSTPERKPGRPRKKAGAEANGDGTRPWEGLFEASLNAGLAEWC
jgi:hypothetical protein